MEDADRPNNAAESSKRLAVLRKWPRAVALPMPVLGFPRLPCSYGRLTIQNWLDRPELKTR